MNDLYLRTDTESEMAWALIESGIWNSDQEPTGIACVDIIGEIHPIIAEDGTVIVEGKTGWHVNVRPLQELDASLLPVLDPAPANPVRVWF